MSPEKIRSRIVHFRLVLQAKAFLGSIGQGAFLFVYVMNALKVIIKPETEKTKSLFSDNQTICGKAPTSPAKVAPIPKETRRAGSAQQKIVPVEVNKDR